MGLNTMRLCLEGHKEKGCSSKGIQLLGLCHGIIGDKALYLKFFWWGNMVPEKGNWIETLVGNKSSLGLVLFLFQGKSILRKKICVMAGNFVVLSYSLSAPQMNCPSFLAIQLAYC